MTVFHCQQFSVQQQQSAMKICTDSLLFGAMAPVKAGDTVLDIGAGNGVLSLMMAQMGAKHITAVEISHEAYQEARINFSRSPWSSRLKAVNQDIQSFAQAVDRHYDVIISNPPFFEQHLKSADAMKRLARHADSLPFADLMAAAEKRLSPLGLFYVLLPTHVARQVSNLACVAGLFLIRQVDYRGFADKPAKVSALSFSRLKAVSEVELLTVYESKGVYTPTSSAYLQPFLLRFAKP